MKRIFFICIAATVFFGFVTAAAGQDTMWRCGNLFVEHGVHSAQVRYNCGNPFSKDRTYLEEYGEVEVWIYGPESGYFYVLYFFVGKLVKLEEVSQL